MNSCDIESREIKINFVDSFTNPKSPPLERKLNGNPKEYLYGTWLATLKIDVEIFDIDLHGNTYGVRFDSIWQAFDQICGGDQILSECMKTTFAKKFGKRVCVIRPEDGELGIFLCDAEESLIDMFGDLSV